MSNSTGNPKPILLQHQLSRLPRVLLLYSFASRSAGFPAMVPLFAALVWVACAEFPSPKLSATDEHKVKVLLSLMTLEEKAGQLSLFSRPAGSDFNGEIDTWNSTLRSIRNGQLGGLFNGQGVKTNRELQRIALEESRLGIPLVFGADVWHGMWTVFPVPLGEAASWEPDLAFQTARAAAREATASGLMWTFSPMVDTARDQRWGRNLEGAGEDPFLGQAFSRARVTGFQGSDLKSPDSLAACLKHFAGYGGALSGLDYSESDISESSFRDVFLPPFIAGIEAGALSIMSAFQALEGIPATGNHWLLTDVLRSELGFQGFVVTDYEADLELVNHGFAVNDSDAAGISLTAGIDMSMQSGIFQKHLPGLVSKGHVSLKRLDEAVKRILSAKAAMGLFDNPYRSLDPSTWPNATMIQEHDKLARHAARQSLVLLKNDGALLPLKKCCQKIGVIGWWITSKDLNGVGVIWGNHSYGVTLLQGLENAVENRSLLRSTPGSRIETRIRGGFQKAIETAKWADVVILALGEPSNSSGESASRTEITIPQVQQDLAEAVAKVGKPIVLLLKNGRALELRGAVKDAEAIMVTWFLGKQSGNAIADVLFGDFSPSGRLPISFPRRGGQQPWYYNHMATGRPCKWGSPWTNCFLEVPNSALYPFGHGLTYTKVNYTVPRLSSSFLPWDGQLTITCNISNLGPRVAEEVVQLYIHDHVASRVRPVRELKGFKKISLEPGEIKEVTFALARQNLLFAAASHAKTDGKYTVEPGVFSLWVAPSSTEGQPVSFELEAPDCPLI